ncbi:MAG: Holliday junction branch migration protein RuvA [Oscillospiraceae bacterium]|nr:Holliday junction branch migration protein RuvA [Oscillospiraceae bacterium]
MIHCLEGLIVAKGIDDIVLSCSGVGFRLYCPTGTYAEIGPVGSSAFMYTHMVVREDAFELYGFVSEEEQQCFRLLIGVSGVGPRIAIAVLSLYSPKQIILAIASGDHKAFTACSGIGSKIAQRIVLELKDKVGSLEIGGSDVIQAITGDISNSKQEAITALVSLGFTTSEAGAAIAKLTGDASTEELVSLALKSLARN